MKQKFENDWTVTHDAMTAALEQRQTLIETVMAENVSLRKERNEALGKIISQRLEIHRLERLIGTIYKNTLAILNTP
jgi:hypothetical protein